jgi:hypothetical protein
MPSQLSLPSLSTSFVGENDVYSHYYELKSISHII